MKLSYCVYQEANQSNNVWMSVLKFSNVKNWYHTKTRLSASVKRLKFSTKSIHLHRFRSTKTQQTYWKTQHDNICFDLGLKSTLTTICLHRQDQTDENSYIFISKSDPVSPERFILSRFSRQWPFWLLPTLTEGELWEHWHCLLKKFICFCQYMMDEP